MTAPKPPPRPRRHTVWLAEQWDRLGDNPEEDALPDPSAPAEVDKTMLPHYVQEWQVIVQTQMHFNDLILKFRSTALTAFVTFFAVVLAAKEFIEASTSLSVRAILLVPFSFWVAAYILDYFYYHRLLLGAVEAASKYDKSGLHERTGLFHMTSIISGFIAPADSRLLVIAFYAAPPLILAAVLHLAG